MEARSSTDIALLDEIEKKFVARILPLLIEKRISLLGLTSSQRSNYAQRCLGEINKLSTLVVAQAIAQIEKQQQHNFLPQEKNFFTASSLKHICYQTALNYLRESEEEAFIPLLQTFIRAEISHFRKSNVIKLMRRLRREAYHLLAEDSAAIRNIAPAWMKVKGGRMRLLEHVKFPPSLTIKFIAHFLVLLYFSYKIAYSEEERNPDRFLQVDILPVLALFANLFYIEERLFNEAVVFESVITPHLFAQDEIIKKLFRTAIEKEREFINKRFTNKSLKREKIPLVESLSISEPSSSSQSYPLIAYLPHPLLPRSFEQGLENEPYRRKFFPKPRAHHSSHFNYCKRIVTSIWTTSTASTSGSSASRKQSSSASEKQKLTLYPLIGNLYLRFEEEKVKNLLGRDNQHLYGLFKKVAMDRKILSAGDVGRAGIKRPQHNEKLYGDLYKMKIYGSGRLFCNEEIEEDKKILVPYIFIPNHKPK